jgi:hypothetical protein
MPDRRCTESAGCERRASIARSYAAKYRCASPSDRAPSPSTSNEQSDRSGSRRPRASADAIDSPTMNACPIMRMARRRAARTIGATTGERNGRRVLPEGNASGKRRLAVPSRAIDNRTARSELVTPSSRSTARRSAIRRSAHRSSGVRSSASARLMSALPCRLSSGNWSTSDSARGRDRACSRAARVHRMARLRAACRVSVSGRSASRTSATACDSGRSVASRIRSRRLLSPLASGARTGPVSDSAATMISAIAS